jgi:menaquinone-dependent protoporphyrinogen oxidase
MSSTTLVAYATRHDSTHRVAETIACALHGHGLDVDVRPAAGIDDLAPYAAVVLGGALYMGRWHRDAGRMLREQRAALAERPFFVFAMGPLTLDAEAIAGSRRQLDHALSHVPEVHPDSIAIFGGVVHPDELRFPLSHMQESDARDDAAIHRWAAEIGTTIRAGRVPASAG